MSRTASADADEHLDEVRAEIVKNGTLPRPRWRAQQRLAVPGGLP